MSKENLIRLTTYAEGIKSRLADPVIPKKHLGREVAYKQFLSRELAAVCVKIEGIKLTMTDGAKK